MDRLIKITLLITVFFTVILSVQSQVLNKPILGFDYACAKDGSNQFEIEISFSGVPFNASNQFFIELSDANGSFSSPVVLKTLLNNDFNYYLKTNISFPSNVYGENYKIRVRSSSPEKVSPPSDSFEAYYITSKTIILNDFKNVSLCNGTPVDVSLNLSNDYKYQWYKDGTRIQLAGNTITVSEPGTYYASIYYGRCTDIINSNQIVVINTVVPDITINGANTIDVCPNDTHSFEASVNDSSFTYEWFKDGTAIDGANQHIYTTPNSNQFGEYYVKISKNGCVKESQRVVLNSIVVENFTVSNVGDLERVILPTETQDLTIAHDSDGVAIKWYKDGVEIPSETDLTLSINSEGTYYAEVSKSNNGCNVVKKSAEFKIYKPNSLIAEIKPNASYSECESQQTKLVIDKVTANTAAGKTFVLTNAQLSLLSYQWYKGVAVLSGETQNEHTVTDYLSNDDYKVRVVIASLSDVSNIVAVKLTTEKPEITSSTASFALCKNSPITLSINTQAGFIYKWFKDNVEIADPTPESIEVSETGVYKVEVSGYGCTFFTENALVKPFEESNIEIDPSGQIVLPENETKTITATGADSYEWFDAQGNLLSSTAELEVSVVGIYKLKASVGGCSVEKTIEVIGEDGKIVVPNVLSPNNDGKNDTWKLPNRYAFQTNVSVTIYNANGKKVFSTDNYQNDWPQESIGNQMIFYYELFKDGEPIKAGTISVIE